jgi:hypothetical protein
MRRFAGVSMLHQHRDLYPVATGCAPSSPEVLHLSSGIIGLVGINSRVPQSVRAKVERIAAKLRAADQARDR